MLGRDDWPLRMIDLPPLDKVRWMQIDPGRYFRQCRAERLRQVRESARVDTNDNERN